MSDGFSGELVKYHEELGDTLDFDFGILRLFLAPLIITRDPQNVTLGEGSGVGMCALGSRKLKNSQATWTVETVTICQAGQALGQAQASRVVPTTSESSGYWRLLG